MREYKRYAKKGDYKPVYGAFCLNLVTAIIDEYKRSPKRLKTIFLNSKHWDLFVEDLKKIDDNYRADALAGVEIEGCDVTVKKGSKLQVKEFVYEFYSDKEIKSMINPSLISLN